MEVFQVEGDTTLTKTKLAQYFLTKGMETTFGTILEDINRVSSPETKDRVRGFNTGNNQVSLVHETDVLPG